MTSQSTVWSQLSLPASPVGSVPFVGSDSLTIATDVQYFWYNQTAHQLSITINGDQTGTDTFNTYYNQDSYWPWSVLVTTPLGANGTTAAHTVSTSRGTGQIPSLSLSGDFIGKFSGWAYTGTSPGPVTYQELGGINLYTQGTNGAQNGIGGELRLFTKLDNGAQTEWLRLTNLGALIPVVGNTVALGTAGFGYSNIVMSYTSNLVPGNGVAIAVAGASGRFQMAAGNAVQIVTNALVTVSTIVMVMLETNDATATFLKSVVPAAGQFTVTVNANATGIVKFSFFLINN